MKDARHAELARLAAMFCRAYGGLPLEPEAAGTHVWDAGQSRLQDTVRYLSDVDRLYRRAEAMPLWPFNPTTLDSILHAGRSSDTAVPISGRY